MIAGFLQSQLYSIEYFKDYRLIRAGLQMKNILFFGDSNTWGFIPASDFERYPYEKRTCGRLQNILGQEYKIIEQALNGRMTAWDDPMNEDKNGSKQLSFILDSQRPLDLVIIMLGVNDMKHYMHLTALDSAMGCSKLIDIVKAAACGNNRSTPEIILVSPPLYVESEKPWGRIFEGAEEKTKHLAQTYKEIANTQDIHFFDASQAVPPYDGDGVHIDENGTKIIAEGLADLIQRIYSL